jgi:hypothetical protein
MSKKTAKTISTIALAISFCAVLYAVLNGMNPIPAIGIALSNVVILFANGMADKKANANDGKERVR